MLAPCKKQRYLGRRETEKYLWRMEKGLKNLGRREIESLVIWAPSNELMVESLA